MKTKVETFHELVSVVFAEQDAARYVNAAMRASALVIYEPLPDGQAAVFVRADRKGLLAADAVVGAFQERQRIAATFKADQRAEDDARVKLTTLPSADPKRRRMLRDVMITAYEGGSAYWAEAQNVIREEDCPEEGLVAYKPGSFRERTGRENGDYISFEVRSFEDRDDPRLGGWQKVDEAAIQRGIDCILAAPQAVGEYGQSPLHVGRHIYAAIAVADRIPYEADIDAEAADCILQAGIYNEIIFG